VELNEVEHAPLESHWLPLVPVVADAEVVGAALPEGADVLQSVPLLVLELIQSDLRHPFPEKFFIRDHFLDLLGAFRDPRRRDRSHESVAHDFHEQPDLATSFQT